ncbi:MAG: urate hydroxylase PuuD [Planctomycetes bacterium]|nr:urate hydroxylase PuuD [Planctomycetota bacterium]
MQFDTTFTTALIRWGHILAGIIWLGFFLFLHFVVRPYVLCLKGEAQAEGYRRLIGRGLRWCRGAGITTFLLGIGVLGHLWAKQAYSGASVPLNGRGRFIMWGMTLAVAMLVNLLFLVSKAQNGILNAFASGLGPSDQQFARVRRLSLVNVYLTGPMLYLMIFANNFGPLFHYGHVGIGVVLGLATMHIIVILAERGARVG